MTSQIAQTDKSVIELLRNSHALTITQLVDQLGVTATAVRQRLNRLVAAGFVQRVEVNSGRGRPVHHYSLTESGFQAAGNNLGDLAKALWEQIHEIEDENVRKKVISGAADRLSQMYSDSIEGETVDQRLQSIAKLFGQREIPFSTVEKDGEISLQVVGCPYPELSETDHSICEMEQELLSKLTNQPLTVSRDHCGCGGQSCTFHAIRDKQTKPVVED